MSILFTEQRSAGDPDFSTQLAIAHAVASTLPPGIRVSTLELTAENEGEMDSRLNQIGDTFAGVPVFVEAKPGSGFIIDRLARHAKMRDVGVKVRTQGMVGEEDKLVHVMQSVAQRDRKLILAGGLHHLVPMKRFPGHPDHLGYLTTLIAAAEVHGAKGRANDGWLEQLLQGDVSSISLDDNQIEVMVRGWSTARYSTETIRDARDHFLQSFSSCSVEQPTRELKSIVPDRKNSPYGSSHLQTANVLVARDW